MSRTVKIVLPILILILAAGAAWVMIIARPDVEKQAPQVRPPLVRTAMVSLEDLRFTVTSQGTVSPRTESRLVPEVSGLVIEVAPSFASGGYFEEGETLVRIDAHDYRQSVVLARAEVARAKLALAQEEAEAGVARKEWEELGNGEATPLTLREPQLENARAAAAAAEAALETARRNLERTEVLAPYDGRVREKLVDVGQFVTVGTPLATLYSVDYAEVRLPLPDDQLAFLELPFEYRDDPSRRSGPKVVLRAEFAGKVHEWTGRVVRTEGEIDRRSRMVHVVARVANPYARGDDPRRPPLAAGMYVEAEIEGTEVELAAVLPRAALRGDGLVYVIDGENRLRFRRVELLRSTNESIVVGAGLEAGEKVILSPMEAVTDGMQVRTADEVAS
jgi:RND family efflux transporter MFP subunit